MLTCTLRLLAVLIAFWGSLFLLKGQSPAPVSGVDTVSLGNQVRGFMNDAISRHVFPGARVLVNYQGETILDGSYGYHTYDSVRAVRSDDIWDIASITKITSVTPALIKLVGEGRFDLDATVGEYFPEFSKSNKVDLVWREILAHNAGLYPWIPFWEDTRKPNGKWKAKTFRNKKSKRFPVEVNERLFLHRKYRKKMFGAIEESPLDREQGYVYSGLAFYILPEIIERITGVPFEQFLKSSIYLPAGAENLTYNPMRHFPLDRIVPTELDTFFRKEQIHGYVHDEGAAMMGGVSGNAGLFGTAEDLLALGELYLNRGVVGGDTILIPETVDEFTRCQYCIEGNRRGLGFDKPPWIVDGMTESVTLCRDAPGASYGHSGYTGTLLWIDPINELVFVFLSNRVYPTRENWQINALKIRPAVMQQVYDAIEGRQIRTDWEIN